MKKIIALLMILTAFAGVYTNSAIADDENAPSEDILKQYQKNPNMNKNTINYWNDTIKEYNQGNYLTAITNIRGHLNKNEDDAKARYYLALCYHKLGMAKEAQKEYQKVIDNTEAHPILIQYATQASACISNPQSAACKGQKEKVKVELTEEEKAHQEEVRQLKQQIKELQEAQAPKTNTSEDDITQFIKSKQKIHPAAMDRITVERMERKIQADEYAKNQEEQNKQ